MNKSAATHHSSPSGRQKCGAGIWALGLMLCLCFLGFRLHHGLSFDTSVLSLLPTSQQSPLEERAYKVLSNQFSNQLVFLLGGEIEKKSAPQNTVKQLVAASKQFAETLASSGHFDTVDYRFDQTVEAQIAFYRPFKDGILSTKSRQKLTSTPTNVLFQQALIDIYNPIAPVRASRLIDDPLNLFSQWLQRDASVSALQVDADGLFVKQGSQHYRFVSATFSGDAFQVAKQQPALDAITLAEQQFLQPQWQLLRSGLLFHSDAAERQAKQELSTIGLGSLAGIVLLLWVYFRSTAPILMTLLALGGGMLFALSVCLLVFQRVHIITLVFGASLVGVAIDYVLHFLVARQYYQASTLKQILPGIRLALLTSIVAYGAQALTPFPGLRQMALFSAAGLTGAWLTVVFFFPLLGSGREKTRSDESTRPRRFIAFNRFGLVLFSLIAIVLMGLGASRLQFDDDIRLLQNSPAALMRQERQIQTLIKSPSAGQFLLVNATNKEQLLQREEALRRELDTLVEQKFIRSYQSLSQQVPSLQQQLANKQLLADKVYESTELTHFFKSLGAPKNTVPKLRDRFAKSAPPLTLDHWLAASASELLSHLWLGPTATASIISLSGINGDVALSKLSTLAARNSGVLFINRTEHISILLGDYRQQITQWILLAYLLVCLLLWRRYQRQALVIILAPLLATLITFSMLSMANIPINLFHILAALLILGIGLDMGIFLNENHYQHHAQIAISLSAVTTLLAFGLLSLSKTPVLFSFGITVLPGIALSWLIASTFLPTLLTSFQGASVQRTNTQ